MKHFFTHTGGKIFHFFWSWGFLKFVLVFATLIVLLYAEEDWRGARAWAATKAKWEARGETFDLSKFTPPPIPDDQNLAAIPLFKIERVEYAPNKFDPRLVNLDKATSTTNFPEQAIPSGSLWMQGEGFDIEKIRFAIAANFTASFQGTQLPADGLDQLNRIYPFLSELRAASVSRPFFQIPQDYSVSPPDSRALGNVTKVLKLSQFLMLDAVVSLDHRQAAQALEDVKINYKSLSGATRDPSLVGGLVGIGVSSITLGAIYNGLALHAWNDGQLSEIDHTLESINFLADYHFAMRAEAAESVTDIQFFKGDHKYDLSRLFGMSPSGWTIWLRLSGYWPAGWWDQNIKQMADSLLSELETVDPVSGEVFINKHEDLMHRIRKEKGRWDAYAPWKVWATLALEPVLNANRQFARAQTWNNEARIACALERYRLANGIYPSSLGGLVPSCIDFVPRDVINGEAYHYSLRSDGTFLLYSVGWNQTDDGGKTVLRKEASAGIDDTQGDWVWPTPIYSKP
jgi:hypothetical protein